MKLPINTCLNVVFIILVIHIGHSVIYGLLIIWDQMINEMILYNDTLETIQQRWNSVKAISMYKKSESVEYLVSMATPAVLKFQNYIQWTTIRRRIVSCTQCYMYCSFRYLWTFDNMRSNDKRNDLVQWYSRDNTTKMKLC
jgi:hypothetical protein